MPELAANLIVSFLCLMLNWKNKANVTCILIVLAAQFGYLYTVSNGSAILYYGAGGLFDFVCICFLCAIRTRMSYKLQLVCLTDAFLCLLGFLTYLKGMSPDYKIAMTLMLYIVQTIVMLSREDDNGDVGNYRDNKKLFNNRMVDWFNSGVYAYNSEKQKGSDEK